MERGVGMFTHLIAAGMSAAEGGYVPDVVVRAAIRRLLKSRLRAVSAGGVEEQQERLQQLMDQAACGPVALVPDLANTQHYEVPADFFRQSLGPRLKYSCCYWPGGVTSLAAAEEAALLQTAEHAELSPGQEVLELGCGWGSFSLWAAERFPSSRFTAVSNSATQRQFIQARAQEAGLTNLQVITADMNVFEAAHQFDRVVSVEMFEHMRNHSELLRRIRTWLKPEGKLLVHVFCHQTSAYAFEPEGRADWMARYFFTGGMMPSAGLLTHYQQDLHVERQWHWSGRHYEKTSNAWLTRMDARRDEILHTFAPIYGADSRRWFGRWRLFHMACAELFGFAGGNTWFVTHIRFAR